MRSAEAAAHDQEQQELRRDVERVVEIACARLSPQDANLLRWASGVQKPEQDPRQMACWDANQEPF